MKSAWAIVAAKALARGKSRLRAVLDDGERASFARALLEHVLDTLAACPLGGVLVATDGDDVARLALERGAFVRRDRETGTLAGVVDGALAEVAARGGDSAIVLMADLPHIQTPDVLQVLAALASHEVAVVRDHLGYHTNALAMTPPGVMATCFGRKDSFAAHCAAARAAGLRLAVIDNPSIAFDVDVPEDHARLRTRPEAET